MPTDAQRNASRANGAKSRGPKTPAGKHNSSRNAITHGLLAETVVLEGECTERFLAVIAELEEEYAPQTATERILVENMAIARWHKLRVVGFNKALLDHESRRRTETFEAPEKYAASAAHGFRKLTDETRAGELINRYGTRYDYEFLRAQHRLLAMQDRRTPPPPIDISEGTQQPAENTQPPSDSNPANPPFREAPRATSAPCPTSSYTRKPDPHPSVIYSEVGRILKFQAQPLVKGVA